MSEEADILVLGQLVDLDLSDKLSRIGNEGITIVSEFLKCNTTLKRLDLSRCSFDDQAVAALATSFKYNRTLKSLFITKNNFSDTGRCSLIHGLEENVTICNLPNRALLSYARRKQYDTFGNMISIRDPQSMIRYLVETRNGILIPAAVRRASLYLIWSRKDISSAGQLAIFPKDIVKMISIELWETRKDPIWLMSSSDKERGEEEIEIICGKIESAHSGATIDP
jgi:hypothetical protein